MLELYNFYSFLLFAMPNCIMIHNIKDIPLLKRTLATRRGEDRLKELQHREMIKPNLIIK